MNKGIPMTKVYLSQPILDIGTGVDVIIYSTGLILQL